MDLLSNRQARQAILDYYQASGEPQAVQEAIKVSARQAMHQFTLERMKREKTGFVNTPVGRLSYEKLADARRKLQIKPPKEISLGVAQALFDL